MEKSTGYELLRKNYGGSYKKVATITRRRNYYIDKGLKRGKNYYYVVRAYKTIDGKKVYSNNSAVIRIKM